MINRIKYEKKWFDGLDIRRKSPEWFLQISFLFIDEWTLINKNPQ